MEVFTQTSVLRCHVNKNRSHANIRRRDSASVAWHHKTLERKVHLRCVCTYWCTHQVTITALPEKLLLRAFKEEQPVEDGEDGLARFFSDLND